MRTVDDMIRQEVAYCVSALVYTLAQGYGTIQDYHENSSGNGRALVDLTEQAFELSTPIDDWEEAAIQEGWKQHVLPDGDIMFLNVHDEQSFQSSWQELCEDEGIEPYQREVFEHWIVSDWLADKLEAKGEKVDRDFAGLTVWGRTTSGQAIAQDGLIEEIHAEAARRVAEL